MRLFLITSCCLLLLLLRNTTGFSTTLFQISKPLSSSLLSSSRRYDNDYYAPRGIYELEGNDAFYDPQIRPSEAFLNARNRSANLNRAKPSSSYASRSSSTNYNQGRRNQRSRGGGGGYNPRRYDTADDLPPLQTRRANVPGRRRLGGIQRGFDDDIYDMSLDEDDYYHGTSRSGPGRRRKRGDLSNDRYPSLNCDQDLHQKTRLLNSRRRKRTQRASPQKQEQPRRGRKQQQNRQLLNKRGTRVVGVQKQLMDYAERGYMEDLRRLLESGGNPNFVDEYGDTPLLRAASNGHAEAVALLLARGAQANYYSIQGETPLYWASCNGHSSVVQILLQQGRADPRIVDSERQTPLHWAAYHGHEQVCQLLMQRYHGMQHATVDPNLAGGKHHKSAMQLAREKGHLGCVHLMESCLMEQKKRREYEARLVEYSATGRVAEVQRLLEGGIPANITNEFGQVPLYVACCNGHSGVVQWLLHYGADPNLASGKDGHTPLYAASWNGHAQVAQQLLDQGADPNVRSGQDGETALYAAATNGQNRVIQILLSRGSDPYLPNYDGHTTPFDAASREGMKLLNQVYYKGSSSSSSRISNTIRQQKLRNRRIPNAQGQRPGQAIRRPRRRNAPVLPGVERRRRFQ